MHPDVAALAHVFGLPADAAEAIDALLVKHVHKAPQSAAANLTFVDEDTLPGDAPLHDAVDAPTINRRYQDLGPIAEGGMGEVRRVRDNELNRTLAMKVVHTTLLKHPAALARFLEEAQATAQLQHPNIVPVHDIGAFEDGRVWFTMKEVRGSTLSEVVQEVHAASAEHWEPGPSGWTFKRVVASFLAVCNAVAYAHERGVVHRDLKPEHVMVGPHGETYVLDWGLAKVVGRPSAAGAEMSTGQWHLRDVLADEDDIVTARSGLHTRMGTVAGTRAYMAPEQARGEINRIDARTDVYALGALLYEILTGQPPFPGLDSREVLANVLAGPPRAVRDLTDELRASTNTPPLPDALVTACERAMSRSPEDRYGSALALATEVSAWLDGARNREQALDITQRSLAGVTQAANMLQRAATLQEQGDALLEGVARWRPEADKVKAWEQQDAAVALRRSVELQQLAVDQGLHGALRLAPHLVEAHRALVERYRLRHEQAETDRDEDELARAETLVRMHAEALPETDPVRRSCATYLKGDGALSVVTDRPGARVLLYEYQLHNRRLVEVPVRELGTTPLREVSVPMGSYLCMLKHPDCDPVRYPAEVPRLGHWDGVAPGQAQATPIWLPPKGLLGAHEVYVPAGWFRSGGDPEAHNGQEARRLWSDALVMQRFPVTNRDYLTFLDDLVARGRTEEALRHAPRERAGAVNEQGALIYHFEGTRFSLLPDAEGDAWLPDYPVLQVDWFGAQAYLRWLAERTNRPWRMPGGLEWEKAARGVDARLYPWGDYLDPSWCCMSDSHEHYRLPAVVDTFPVDISPYGVRGLGGNTYDWCADLTNAPQEVVDQRVTIPDESHTAGTRVLRRAKGGHWGGSARVSRLAVRQHHEPTNRDSNLGIRGVYRPDCS